MKPVVEIFLLSAMVILRSVSKTVSKKHILATPRLTLSPAS